VNFAEGSTWRHASVIGSYNDHELGSILIYLCDVEKSQGGNVDEGAEPKCRAKRRLPTIRSNREFHLATPRGRCLPPAPSVPSILER
jgi:hypothetical protein